MRFILTAIGSYGDVHPFVGLGKALAARGHDVTIVANPYFSELIASAGLRQIELRTREEYEQLAENRNLWHWFKGPQIVVRDGQAAFARELYETIVAHFVPGETVVAAHGLDLGSRIAQEKHGVPVASVVLAPLQVRSNLAPPAMPFFFSRHLPFKWPRRLQHWLVDRVVVDRMLSGPINGLRAELGISPPVSRFFDRWWYSPQLVICLFPDWFAPAQSDWPSNTLQAGFPLWDESDQTALPPDVAAFLDDGEPPVVFVPGSAMMFGQAFFAAAADACRLIRRRGILLTKYPEQLPDSLPDGVRCFGFVPLSHVLPRAAAFVHHGGIGSTSQGLAAGVPQLVMPRNFDQPDNAERLVRLGVAEVLRPRRFRGPAVAAAIARLIEDADVAATCGRLAGRCHGPRSFSAACEALEQLRPTVETAR